MKLETHGRIALRSGRALLETSYRPGDAGPGTLSLRLEDQETFESVEGRLRLDPWIGDEYRWFELHSGNYLVIAGAEAVVAVDATTLGWLSSVALEHEEGETIDGPWHVEVEAARSLIVATERRLWCMDERGAIRWLWSCSTAGEHHWIGAAPTVRDNRVLVSLRTPRAERTVEIHMGDGLPISA